MGIATGNRTCSMHVLHVYYVALKIITFTTHLRLQYIFNQCICILKLAHLRLASQLFLLLPHQELRVWTLQDQLCLQICHRLQQLGPQPPSAFFLHPHSGLLFIGTNQVKVPL